MYLRDSRRGFGLTDQEVRESLGAARLRPQAPPARPTAGYRMLFWDESTVNDSSSHGDAVRPADVVGVQLYNEDCHRLSPSVCTLPSYMEDHITHPFYLSGKMLLQSGGPNLLLAGKTAAMSFHANGAVRLHPGEWTLGVAAGAGAVLYRRHSMNATAQLLADGAQEWRSLLASLGQPLEWSDLPVVRPQIGWICAGFGGSSVCVGTDTSLGGTVFPTDVCQSACSALGPTQWLAFDAEWTEPDAAGEIKALQNTYLKKSIASSTVLPSSELRAAPQRSGCTVAGWPNASKFHSYWLCEDPQ
jgi:hypothetical protein